MSDAEEEFISEDEGEGPGLVKKLREKLKKAVEEKQEYLEGWQRARADFANYKREEAGLHGDKTERIKAEFVESLLPALDALELARRHSSSTELEIVEKQFMDVLKRFGVEKFGASGEQFNPHIHEALSGDGEHIANVERSGYKIGAKIIRPAQVIL